MWGRQKTPGRGLSDPKAIRWDKLDSRIARPYSWSIEKDGINSKSGGEDMVP